MSPNCSRFVLRVAGFAAVMVAGLANMTDSADGADKIEFAIAIHGGAGLDPDPVTDEQKAAYHDSLRRALEVGRKILADGGTALDAVEQTIRVLEDDPLYNAGRGAVFNREGRHELDASIMDGKTGGAGGVAGLTTVKNPISLARLVMTETRHVLLQGEGAERFADEMRSRPQIERVPNHYFDTEFRRRDWQETLEKEQAAEAARKQGQAAIGKQGAENDRGPKQDRGQQNDHGTVGCVALDKHGNLAAGTSTGGVTNKKWGRVGDSPIIGAGTYANNATCAVSCTGTGEYYIKHSVAFHVSALMEYKGLSLDKAAAHIIDDVLPDDCGGLIAVDRNGHISLRMNTAMMARGAADSTGRMEVMLGK